eukprot:SAG31_NODE_16088_length_723_cov_1.280449_1_plen_50_part_00
MKFGRYIAAHIDKECGAQHYVDYAALKKFVKVSTSRAPRLASPRLASPT